MSEIRIKHFVFKPGLLPSIATCLLLWLMLYLGNWQLDRAEYKGNLQSIIESRQTIKPAPLNSLIDKQENDWLYHPVLVSGKYDSAHQIYLDNQVHNMVAGFSIFTPLKISAHQGILINRGWVAVGKSRYELPNIKKIGDEFLNIKGLLTPPPSKGLVLSSTANDYLQWPAVLQFIDTREIEKTLGYSLLPMTLTINSSEQTDYEIIPIKINMRSEKHTAYAFQWFALSLTLLFIYIVVNTKKQLNE